MDDHFHLLVEPPENNVSLGMRHLNGVYIQRFNRKHNHVGHVYQDPLKPLLFKIFDGVVSLHCLKSGSR